MILTFQQAELLATRLQEWNLLAGRTGITAFRKINAAFPVFYKMEGSVCGRYGIDGLMPKLGIDHELTKWRLFNCSAKYSSFIPQWKQETVYTICLFGLDERNTIP